MNNFKSVKVMVENYGEFELREPLFADIEQFFGAEATTSFGISLLKKCVFKDNVLLDWTTVSATLGVKLMSFAPQIMEMVGFNNDEGKTSVLESK